MLILTRRAGVTGALGTTTQIGDDVWIRILAVRNGQVKIGIIAPNDKRVLRDDCQHSLGKPYVGPGL